MPHETAARDRNRAERNPDAELDALVAVEFAELQSHLRPEAVRSAAPPSVTVRKEEQIDIELDRLARRLRGHPDRTALIDRLRAASEGEGEDLASTSGDAPAAAVPTVAGPPRDLE